MKLFLFIAGTIIIFLLFWQWLFDTIRKNNYQKAWKNGLFIYFGIFMIAYTLGILITYIY